MFTGLIAEVGTLEQLVRQGEACRLKIAARLASELASGASVAVNGVCLTVTRAGACEFCADVMPETARLSNLGQLKPGAKVNLERALTLADALAGHFVSGHVEGTGAILKAVRQGNALLLTIAAPKELLPYIMKKGSIAVDGVSLTVIDVTSASFSVGIIPHTAAETTLGAKRAGALVNLETDLLARYLERLLAARQAAEPQEGRAALDLKDFAAKGFI